MEKRQNSISSGSGTKNGEPLSVDYRQLLKDKVASDKKALEALGDVATSSEIANLLEMPVATFRCKVTTWVRDGVLRRASVVGGRGARKWLYSLEDIYKLVGGGEDVTV
jgi:hypothetical protein